MIKDGRLEAVFKPHYGKPFEEIADEFVHRIVFDAFERRSEEYRVTSEFFVYERDDNGTNYYLTLVIHGEWTQILARIEMYKAFDRGGI